MLESLVVLLRLARRRWLARLGDRDLARAERLLDRSAARFSASGCFPPPMGALVPLIAQRRPRRR